MRPRILLLSGTSEGPPLARSLLDAGMDVVATVTCEEASVNLFGPLIGELSVEVGGFDGAGLRDYLRGGIDAVLDATHPFAARITLVARDACAEVGIPYVRYERPDCEPPQGSASASTFAEAAEMLPTLGTRAMLTIGSKQLRHFGHLHRRLALFARILPSSSSLHQAFEAGFTPDRIFCLRPPFSRAFNRAFFAEYRADVLVTKASGVEGGVVEKCEAARDLGMAVLMIRRPDLEDDSSVSEIAEAVAACRERVGLANTPRPG